MNDEYIFLSIFGKFDNIDSSGSGFTRLASFVLPLYIIFRYQFLEQDMKIIIYCLISIVVTYFTINRCASAKYKYIYDIWSYMGSLGSDIVCCGNLSVF